MQGTIACSTGTTSGRSVTVSSCDCLKWRKSTKSVALGACVEVAITCGCVAVRDSKNPDGVVLLYSEEVWRSFVAGR